MNALNNIKHEDANEKKKQSSTPSKYMVIMHDDDYTTMEFVVAVLQRFFAHNERSALKIMLTIHRKGKGICGIYTAEIAETKMIKVIQYARQHRFPLCCTMEKMSG